MVKKLYIFIHLFYTFLTFFLFYSCGKPYDEKLTFIKKILASYEDSVFIYNPKTAYKGVGYNHLDKFNMFGKPSLYELPDSLINKEIRVYIHGYIRTNDINAKHSIVIALGNKDGVNYRWHQLDARKYCKVPDQWCLVNDSSQIPSRQNAFKNAIITIFGFGPTKKTTFDLDEMEVTLKLVEQVNRIQK